MEKKPHGREKKVVEGSVSVNKTEKVDTGSSKPVGAGGRPGAGGQSTPPRPSDNKQTPSPRRVSRAAGGGGSMFLLIVLAFLLLKTCGGGGAQSNYTGAQTNTQQQVQVTQAPVITQAPVVTPEPTQAPTQAPTAAPVTAASARAKFYTPKKNDAVTIMVYMCGTDLESNYGMATSDLQEMASSKIGSNVNVIVETGGCKMWKNKIVSNSANQYYKVETGGVRLLETLPKKSMVDNATLTEFIRYCRKNYPAQRNILIFWDHGGGSISGYGYDETQPKSAGTMDLAEISAALKATGGTYDWIGFDACLMATLETAVVCSDYADYLIASEETEPGTGWYYTNWVNMLSQKTNVDTVTLGSKIIDDFVSTSTSASSSAQVTLSLVDLAEMQGAVPAAFRNFSTSTAQLLSNKDYATVSNARAGARQFARSNRINQIDLVDFANRINTPQSQQLSQALLSCVKYNKSTMSHAYGISIYFPYESTSTVRTAVSTYQQMGMDEEYTKCITSFASLASSGQLTSAAGNYGSYGGGQTIDLGSLLGSYLGGSSSSYGSSSGSYSSYSSPLGALLGGSGSGSSSSGSSIDPAMVMQLLGALANSGRSMPQEMDWLDADLVAENADFIAENYIDPAEIMVTVRSDGQRVLSLTEEQWDLIQTAELNVFVDDGEGYIDMGLDNTGFEYDGDDMLMTFDGTWLTVNGHAVAYYMTSDVEEDDGSYTTRGHIPAMLTQTLPAELALAGEGGLSSQGQTVTQFVYLDVVFDAANPDGVITGARPMYEGETEALAKGDIQIRKGDVLEFLCDYYTYEGDFESTYKLGEPLTVGDDGLTLANMALENETLSVTYRLTDIYSNYYWTPAWIY